MRFVSEEDKVAERQRMEARLVKVRAQKELDRQKVPWNEKKYSASAEEVRILLDAGADIVRYEADGKKTFIRLMYEAIPMEFESDVELIHPRLPGATKKAG